MGIQSSINGSLQSSAIASSVIGARNQYTESQRAKQAMDTAEMSVKQARKNLLEQKLKQEKQKARFNKKIMQEKLNREKIKTENVTKKTGGDE